MTPQLEDYVDVAERIQQFKERWPNGVLQSYKDPYLVDTGDKTFVVYSAAAYRTDDDPRPGIGWAWEPVPGPTPFTRDSELQNAETSAWGRAIVALGFETKKIASRQEVQNRQETQQREPEIPVEDRPSNAQHRKLAAVLKELEHVRPSNPDVPRSGWEFVARDWIEQQFNKRSRTQLTRSEMGLLIDQMEQRLADERVPIA